MNSVPGVVVGWDWIGTDAEFKSMEIEIWNTDGVRVSRYQGVWL